MEHSQTFFSSLGSRVLFNSTTPSAHSWPTDGYGTACGSGVIEDCGYDGPGACLNHIYPGLRKPVEADASRLREFDQRQFMTENNNGTETCELALALNSLFQNALFACSLCLLALPPLTRDRCVDNATMPPVTGLADSGYIYVPSGCDKPGARCKLHFSLHGCGVNEYYDGARSICLLMH